jgi:hypothetical protein
MKSNKNSAFFSPFSISIQADDERIGVLHQIKLFCDFYEEQIMLNFIARHRSKK